MTGAIYKVVSTQKWAHSREKFGPVQAPVPVSLVAARAQDYLAIPDFSVRDTILISILNHVTS
jgi:hypothetical protein